MYSNETHSSILPWPLQEEDREERKARSAQSKPTLVVRVYGPPPGKPKARGWEVPGQLMMQGEILL